MYYEMTLIKAAYGIVEQNKGLFGCRGIETG
jgi:hypothetical protein